jgi:hypothetical protein
MLSADSALMPQSQVSLTTPAVLARTTERFRGADGTAERFRGADGTVELRPQLFHELQQRWNGALSIVNPAAGHAGADPAGDGHTENTLVSSGTVGSPVALFDWHDRTALLAEVDLINRAQAVLDEAAVKIAPCLLRIVLTVKANLPEAKAQRAFLGEHLQLDFRRISELCIVAESYGLLDPRQRDSGAREIERYGWSAALKLAYVRSPRDRQDLWERACAGRPRAGYRDVLEQIQLFRERKLLAAPAHPELERKDLVRRLNAAQEHVSRLAALAPRLRSRMDYQNALELLETVTRELAPLKRALQDRLEAEEHAALAGQG